MLTPKELERLANYLVVVFKDIFATKEDFNELKNSFSELQSSVDAIARDKTKREQEAIIMAYRMKNAEDWIDLAAPKVGVEFSH